MTEDAHRNKRLAQLGNDRWPARVDAGYWAGHQIFRCAGCGYTHVSEDRTDDPPRYCRRCADNRYDPDSSW